MKKLVVVVSLFIMFAATAAAQTWAVAVNAADAIDLGTIGIEGSAAVGQHWSIHAGARFNPWTFGKKDTFNGLFSEPNANILTEMLDMKEYHHIEIKEDQFGKQRMIRGKK